MADYADVLIDIRGEGTPVEGAPNRLAFDAVVQVQGSGLRRGRIEVATDLDISNPAEYGRLLGAGLTTPALEAALVEARALSPERIRIRLPIDERAEALQPIRWELVQLASESAPDLAASDRTAFSRYVPLAEQDRTPPSEPVFSVLIAFANPIGLTPDLQIPVETEIRSLLNEFDAQGLNEIPRLRVQLMPGRTSTSLSPELKADIAKAGWTLIEGSTGLRQIQTTLQKGAHALHLVCHGRALPDRSELTLEDDNGARVQVQDALLTSWYTQKLQLMVFQACRTSVVFTDRPPYSHIAGRMLQLGVPAVVAMQDLVTMDDARYFAGAFYRALLREGLVDVAATRGRSAMREKLGEKNWSIPALFMRLKGGRLWSPDPVREYLLRTLADLGDEKEDDPLPLKVVEHRGGIDYDPAAGAFGPWFSMNARTSELLHNRGAMVVLTGPQGSRKAIEAERVFREFAAEWLTRDGDVPGAPVLARLRDFSVWGNSAGAGAPSGSSELLTELGLIATGVRQKVPDRFRDARFTILIGRGDETSHRIRIDALVGLARVLQQFPGSSCLLIYGESQLGELRGPFPKASVLVVQPMNWVELKSTLRVRDSPLVDKLSLSRTSDLATSPWLLGEIREQVRTRGIEALSSRARVLGTCVENLLARVDTTKVPLGAVEAVLRRIAWQIQDKRPMEIDAAAASTLRQADADAIIASTRGAGEFSIADMRRQLSASGLLSQTGEGDVRFPNQSIQAYLTARHIAAQDRPGDIVDGLAATFGRLGRLRYWTETLVIAAAMPEFKKQRRELLDSVLTGSSMLEGEQVFLAARLFVEMSTADARDPAPPLTPVQREFEEAAQRQLDKTVQQIVDSLVWRARDVDGRTYEDRKKAVAHLGAMRHPGAVPHLIQIAVDKVRASVPGGTLDSFDVAGLRFLAMDGLWQQDVETTIKEVEKRPDAKQLDEVITAWKVMYADLKQSDTVMAILKADEPYRSPIAAFALVQFGADAIKDLLLPLYWDTLRDQELLWCISEGLASMDGDWLATNVIDPGIERLWSPDASAAREDLRAMLCYLVGQLADAPPDSRRRAYLERTLAEGEPDSRVWALRSLARLRDADSQITNTDSTPQSIAHAILNDDRSVLDRWNITPTRDWQQGALEALRTTGTPASMDVIRDARLKLVDPGLFRFSFQVVEEIYWRNSGGMIQPTT